MAFCAPEEMDHLKDIQKVMKLSIPVLSGRAWEPVPDPNAKPAGGRGRGRAGGKPGGGRPGAPGTSKPSNRRRRKPKAKGPRPQ